MYPIIMRVDNLIIYSHGLLAAIGFLVGGLIIWYLSRKEKLQKLGKKFDIFDFLIWNIILAILGARLVYVILYYKEFISFWDIFTLWNGGLVSFGGIIAVIIFSIWYLKRKDQNIWPWLDIGVLGFLTGWFFGRLGCYLAGDIPGKMIAWQRLANLKFFGQPPIHPVALYEALLTLILFLIFLFLYRKKILDEGLIFISGMSLYFLGRFFIDFLRDERIIFLRLSLGQIASFVILIGFLILGFIRQRQSK